jgi:hypothetical protein
VVVGQSQVHDGPRHDLVTSDDWSVDDGVHAQNGALRRIEDGSSHHGTECATVGDGESSALHVFDGDLAFTSLLCEIGESLNSKRKYMLEVVELHGLAVPEHWHKEASGSGHSDRHIDKVASDDFVSVDNRVDHRILLQGESRCLHEERHKAELDTVLLEEILAELLSLRGNTLRVAVASNMSTSWKVVSKA